MQSNIFELIDLLVKMSSSISNIDELKADLNDTNEKINLIEQKIKNFENDINDEKYFDASSEIVDRNIKISLVKKIQKLNKIKSDLETELDQVKEEEKNLHDEISTINNEIELANEYNSVINSNTSEKESFNNMISTENERLSKLISKQSDLSAAYSKIQKKIEYLSDSLYEVKDKISKEEDRLNEIDHNLTNVRAYVDFEAKEKDEKNYQELKDELDSYLNKKSSIENDPVYIACLIKENIANENKDLVEENFNRLINIIKSKPYMDLENNEIQYEMQKLDDELKRYDSEISQKEYHNLDSKFLEERISFIEDNLKTIHSNISKLEERKSKIETDNEIISSKIYKCDNQILDIEESLSDYEDYDYDNGELSRSVIQAANNKLIEEKENIKFICDNYKKDLVENIKELNLVESKLVYLKESVESKENELDELNKRLALNTESKNILEEEKDRLTLENINKKINDLKFREEFKKSVSEILNEFEMLNSSLEFVDKKTRVQRNFEDDNISSLDDLNNEISNETEVSENFDNKDSLEESVPSDNVDTIISDQNENNEIPIIGDDEVEEPVTERLRVVEVIPITDKVSEKEEEHDFMVNDFQDEDYVNLDEALSTVEENKNEN